MLVRSLLFLAAAPLLVSCTTSGSVVGGAADAGAPEVSFVDAVPLDVTTGLDAGDATVDGAGDADVGDSYADAEPQLGLVTFSPPPQTSFSYPGGTVTMIPPAGFPADGAIYYATDGTNPDHNSTVYAGPVHVTLPTTFRAIASAPGYQDSNVAPASYDVAYPDCSCAAPPVFNPKSGTFVASTLIGLSEPTGQGSTLCYTLDGSQPTCTNGACTGSSLTYSSATRIRLDGTVTHASPPGTVTVTAIGCEAGYVNTAEVQATYTLALAAPYLASTNADGAGLPGWDWSGTGQPLTTMTLPGDAGAPYGAFAAQQVGLLPC
ncbi:MAG TPA: FN3 associated domain-containing protein, partial [Polyangiaceae bacterium]